MNIEKMGGAISHWLGFQDKIGRAFMMNEDAIKYPLADYLVNDGGVRINSINLEYSHPHFPDRLIDVVVKNATNEIVNAFELKLAKPATRDKQERQRIFNDVVRLYFANQISEKDCYFVITGKSAYFERDFHNLTIKGTKFYQKWFSFVKGKQTVINIDTETNTKYREIYDSFAEEYGNGFHVKGQLQLPTQITTVCQFLTAFTAGYVPYVTGIWSIK